MTENLDAPWRRKTFIRMTLIMLMPLFFYSLRVLYFDRGRPMLPWNLFLAWLPLLFAYLALWAGGRRRLLFWPLIGAWLVFLPNAPYLITDLIWLNGPVTSLKVYDAVLLYTFATCGLASGFISLRWLQVFVAPTVGKWGSRLFVLVTLGLSGFGIYLGRFRRWNSWDIVADPMALLHDITIRFADPVQHWRTWAHTALFAGLLLGLYVLLGLVAEVAIRESREAC